VKGEQRERGRGVKGVLTTYLSVGNSMTVWNLPCRAAGPSPTSMYLLSSVTGELIWACVRAWASSRLSSLVDGDDTIRDLGRDSELWPAGGEVEHGQRSALLKDSYYTTRCRSVISHTKRMAPT